MIKSIVFTCAVLLCCSLSHADDELLEKIMKEGFKGKTSPMAKVVKGEATPDETKTLTDLVHSMKGTKAPIGDQADYDKRVSTLIASLDAVAKGDHSEKALGALKKASDCKSCHSEHRPKH